MNKRRYTIERKQISLRKQRGLVWVAWLLVAIKRRVGLEVQSREQASLYMDTADLV